MIRKFTGVVLSIAVLMAVAFPAHATVWTITGGSLHQWFSQGVNGSALQNIYESGFGTNADTSFPRVNGYNCPGIGGSVDLTCGDDAGEGAVPEIWGASAVYSGTIDDVAITGTINWTGESGTGCCGFFEEFTSSITSGSYDIAANTAGPSGTFSCWNNPAAVNSYGTDFCANGTGGATITTRAANGFANKTLADGMIGFLDNMDGTITVTLADSSYNGCVAAGPTNCVPDSSSANTYAVWVFDAMAVPVPAALWLFGSALGLLGWTWRNWRGS